MKSQIALSLAWLIIMLPIAHAQLLQGPTTDTEAPEITNVQFAHGPQTIVTWSTDEPADSMVEYGNTTALGLNETKTAFETAHSITLTTAETETYYYRITSCDAAGNCKSTATDSFVAGPFFVKADIPRYPRASRIDIPGSTRPGAEVTININGVDARKATIADGTFLFRLVDLPQTDNTITVSATLGDESAEETYEATIDIKPPVMNISIEPVLTTASTTAKVRVSEPTNLTVQVGNQTPTQSELEVGENEVSVSLQPGENMVAFTAIDKAGFKSFLEERVIYDTGPPSFVETNLRALSGFPTYKQEIEIRGKLSEPGSVTAFVNGNPKETETTEPDGSFKLKVRLERTIEHQREKTRAALETDIGWKNKVKLEAIDAAGLKATTEEVEVNYAICGFGTWIDVQLTDPLPDVLTPRLLIEGIQQIGIGFNYTYRGGGKANINPREIRVKKLTLAPEFQDEYDNNLVNVYTPPVRAQRARKPSGVGYIQINFQPIRDPWKLPEEEKKTEVAPQAPTMYDRELRVSQHREGDCIAPGLGCMRLFLELEIPFQEVTKKLAYDPRIRQTLEREVTEPLIQRTCVNVEVAIDRRIPPDVLPTSLLETVSEILASAIETIDTILQPIETIGKYLFYSCIAGTFLSFVPIFLEKYNCQYKKFTTLATGKGFNEAIAEIGACDEEYADDPEIASECNTCQKWKENRRSFESTYRQLCDRVMCPAAPSLQYYLKTKGRDTPEEVPVSPQTKGALGQYAVGGKLLAGSDCAAWVEKEKKQVEAGTRRVVLPPRMIFTTQEVQDIYTNWLKHKSDSDEETTGEVNCAGLHPATPECCGYEYMQEWSSACGVSALGNLDTFDEIKESTCLSAQTIGKNEIKDEEGNAVQCNKLLNALSGFCSKDGGPPLTAIRVTDIADSRAEELELQKYVESRELYIIVQEQQPGQLGPVVVGEGGGHTIRLGLIVKSLEFERSDKPDVLAVSERSRLTEKLEVVEYPGYTAFQEKWFSQEQIDAFKARGTVPNGFATELCQASGKTVCPKLQADKGRNIYEQVLRAIGTPEREYIVRPNDGIVNSARCLCFPTLISYLKLWSKIMGAVRNCVNTILFTGDGEAGACQAVISRYACDLLYEVLSCFTQKFGTGNARAGVGPGGDIMGALVSAGSEMSRSVEGRYGDTGMYRAVFVDRKLVHSICMYAFTGTWNFDVAAVFDQSVEEVPIDSVALMYPCTRRYVAYNPTTRPGGLVTWVYHFGTFLAAGADMDVELRLRCSGGFNCREADGFENGKCDCDTPRETVIVPQNLPSRVQKNEIISEEIFYTMAASPGPAAIRYDQAYLVYRWRDGTEFREEKTEPCTIGLTGGPGTYPAHCRFDPFTQTFRCQFGETPGAIRIKEGKVDYPQQVNERGTYAIRDNLNITLSIQQDYPDGERYNKHLQFEVINQAGETVKTNKDRGLFLLTTNGDYTKKIGTDSAESLYPIAVERTWFGVSDAEKKYQVKQWTSMNPSVISPNTMISEAKLFTPQGVESDERKQFVLELERTGAKITYKVYTSTLETRIDKEQGFVSKLHMACTGTLTGDNIVCSPTGTTAQPAVFSGTLRITLTANRPADGETIQSHIIYNAPKLRDPCSGSVKDRPHVQFKIRFAGYDSDQYGQPTDQISLDPITGADAVLEVPFTAMCVDKDDPDFKNLATGIPVAERLADDLKKLLGEMITAETGFLETARKDADPTVDKTAESVLSNLQTLMTKEEEFANRLEPIVKGLSRAERPLNDLEFPTRELQNALGPFTGERPANSIQAAAQETIDRINAMPVPKNMIQVSEEVDVVVTVLGNLIREKNNLVAEINRMIGAPEAIDCPDKQKDAAGNYYVCAAETPEGYVVTEKLCPATGHKCYQLPIAKQCTGIKNELRHECQDGCLSGWAPSTDYMCTEAEKTCCTQSILGAPISALEQVQLIKNYLFTEEQKVKFIEAKRTEYDNLRKISDEQAAQYLVTAQKEQMATQIATLSGDVYDIRNNLDAIIERPLQTGEISKVPSEVRDYSGALNALGREIELQETAFGAAASPSDVKRIFAIVYSHLNTLYESGNELVAPLNSALGIQATCPETSTREQRIECRTSCDSPWQTYTGYSCGGGQSCCQLNPLLTMVPSGEWNNVLGFLERANYETLTQEQKNHALFCAYVETVPEFNYGRDVLKGSTDIKWPTGSMLQVAQPAGKTAKRAVSADFEPGADLDDIIDSPYYYVSSIEYTDGDWYITYHGNRVQVGKQAFEYRPVERKFRERLSSYSEEIADNSQITYFDNSEDGRVAVKTDYCTVTLKNEPTHVWVNADGTEVYDGGTVHGAPAATEILETDGPWYAYRKSLLGYLAPDKEKIITVSRVV